MMRFGKEKGSSRLGCVVLLLLASIFVYLCYRIIPVYLEKEAFESRVLSVAGKAVVHNWDDRKVIQQVMDVARSTNFQVERENIQIRRIPGRANVILIVDFKRTEEFPGGYIYVFQFRSVLEGVYGI